MTVVSVSMPEDLVDRIDAFVEQHGYSGRSEVLRDAARGLLDEFEDGDLADRELMAVVTVLFNFETSNVEQSMTDLRHAYEDIVASNIHSHVGDDYCLELFILDGDLDSISEFVNNVRSAGESVSVEYSIIPVDSVSEALPEYP